MPDVGLIRGRYVVCGVDADGEATVVRDGAVAHADGWIVEVGAFEDLARKHPQAEVVGSPDAVLLPGFVNAHHHVGLTPTQLGSLDHPLELWLITRMGARPVDFYLDTLYSAFELIRSGVTTVQHLEGRLSGPPESRRAQIRSILKAYADVGMRVSFCAHLRDQSRYVYEDDQAFLQRLPPGIRAELEALLTAQALPIETQLESLFDDLLVETGGNRADDVRVQLAPANLHWCSDAALGAIAERAAGTGVPLHMHLLETIYQREYATRRTGGSAVDHLERLGLLTPALTLGHGVWLNDGDIEMLAASGAMICHNPSSNLRLHSGMAPVNALLAKGVVVALGIDEAGINDDRDMLLEARLALVLHRPPGIDSRSPSAAQVLRMATEHGARTTGFGATIGRLDAGCRADVTVVDWSQVAYPYLDEEIGVVDAVLRRAKPSMVRSVVVDGRLVLDEGRIARVDEAAALEELAQTLRGPLPEEVLSRRRLAAELLPYARHVYAGWLDGQV